MKKFLICILCVLFLLFTCSCGNKKYILTEDTFFLVMTNMQYYPEQYADSDIEYDCFTYSIKDINGEEYICGVRKCSSGFGCTCGKDTIIGFLLDYDGELPSPKNQSEDTVEKSWIHLKGKLKSTEKKNIKIRPYLSDGSIDQTNTETIVFLEFKVDTFSVLEDYQNLKYYVTK